MKSIILPLVLVSGLAMAEQQAPQIQLGGGKENTVKITEDGKPLEEYQHAEADKEIEQAFTWISQGEAGGKFDDAYAVFLKYSLQGSSVAQYGLANMLKRGWGVEANQEESLRWLIESSVIGFPKSQYQLALAYRTGKGAKQDFKKAKEWYEAAAIYGHNQAMVDLAGMLLHGMGMPVDKETAVIWLKKAAGDNFGPAIAILDKIEGKPTH